MEALKFSVSLTWLTMHSAYHRSFAIGATGSNGQVGSVVMGE
jgi:hypothetical protein